jgi:alpha-glucosidase
LTELAHVRPAPAAARSWWQDAVIYQLYCRSFADSDGDGVGDLDGIAARLDHIASLGVNGIWLNPSYPSPGRDGGYDVADYLTIDEALGGLPAFERLLAGAHARDLKVLMDLVPNHCSDQHAWFQAALAAEPGSPQRQRFIFRDGRGTGGDEPPNNWTSVFGGPAWTRVTEADGRPGQWYLHSFDATQPDFDWTNPAVAEMFDGVLRTWFDRGIDGFRIDVAYAMVKHPDLPDLDDADDENPYLWNQPGVHDIFTRWRGIAASYDRELMLVGEVWLPPQDAIDYIRPGELHQVFLFDLMQQPFEAAAFRASIGAAVDDLDRAAGVPAWTLNSHDVHRSVTRYGLVEPEPMHTADLNALRTRARGRVDVALGAARARAALLITLALPGAVYLYQGEELGLPEVQDLPDEARRDPIWSRSGGAEYGRDGSRVPLPWTADAATFGFSPAGAAAPWLPQPDWFARFAVAEQDRDPASMLAFYRRALAVRREVAAAGALTWLDTGRDDVLALRRGALVCLTVFDGGDFAWPAEWGTPLLRSGSADGPAHRDETVWLRMA